VEVCPSCVFSGCLAKRGYANGRFPGCLLVDLDSLPQPKIDYITITLY